MWTMASRRELEKSVSQAAHVAKVGPQKARWWPEHWGRPQGRVGRKQIPQVWKREPAVWVKCFKHGLASYRSIISGHLTMSSTSWPTCSLFWILLGKWENPLLFWDTLSSGSCGICCQWIHGCPFQRLEWRSQDTNNHIRPKDRPFQTTPDTQKFPGPQECTGDRDMEVAKTPPLGLQVATGRKPGPPSPSQTCHFRC